MRVMSDSSLDLCEELQGDQEVVKVPFHIYLDDKEYVDEPELDLGFFRKMMAAAGSFSTSCPTPERFMEALKGATDVFGLTITSKLSGSYNAAMLAKRMLEEDSEQGKIHIFDTKSASTGLALSFYHLTQTIRDGLDFSEIVEKVEKKIEQMHTYFISESLENLQKAGRLKSLQAIIAKTLHIVPIMGADDGEIRLFARARGKKRAYKKLVEMICEAASNWSERVIVISHANNLEQAQRFCKELQEKLSPKKIFIVPMGALNTLYADNKGIIVSF